MSTRSERWILFSVTLGGTLEWYEFFLYAYLAPLISKNFFPDQSNFSGLINTLLIFAVGFFSRPLGALFFGHIGDRYGRKAALITSIIMITIPSFAIGCLPTFLEMGFFAPLMLLCMRLLQGFLVGGEISGIMCYLVEDAAKERRRYMASWTFFGPQVGAILSILECYFLEKYLSEQALLEWGWRLSFMIGGAIGLLGCFLRYGLKETPFFHQLQLHRSVSRSPVLQSFKRHKKNLTYGFLISALPLAGDFLIFAFFPIYSQNFIGSSTSSSLIISALMLMAATLFLPIFGKLNQKYSNRSILLCCAGGILLLAYPLFASFSRETHFFSIGLAALMILLFSCYFAISPLVTTELFPTTVRYSCVGISYNLSSAIFGGTAPVAALYLTQKSQSVASPSLILIVASLFSIGALIGLKEKKTL